jgi:hypothetical protein
MACKKEERSFADLQEETLNGVLSKTIGENGPSHTVVEKEELWSSYLSGQGLN